MTGFWVGSYTASMGGDASGIGWAVTASDGSLEYRGAAAEASSPSFLAHGAGDILYAVDEAAGRVEAYGVVGEGMLEPLGGRATSGAAPCHISVTPSHVFVSNYTGGTADRFALNPDGTIGDLLDTLHGTGSGPHAAQDGPHLHATLVVGGGVLSADLGSDRVREQRPAGDHLELAAETDFPAGTGPRDLLRSGDDVFLLGELNGGLFRLGEHGAIQASGEVVADWVSGDHAAALAEHRGYLYTGLRGSNRIAAARRADLAPAFAIPTGGDWPRHLVIADDILHVANQLSSTVTSFRLDPATGIPTPLGAPSPVPSPTYLLPAR